jgi:hypothetical protein
MSHWNHRVMRLTDRDGDPYDAIYEVYYNDDGTVSGWTESPASPSFYPSEDDGQNSILDDIRRFERATTLPTLDHDTGLEIS